MNAVSGVEERSEGSGVKIGLLVMRNVERDGNALERTDVNVFEEMSLRERSRLAIPVRLVVVGEGLLELAEELSEEMLFR